MRPARFPHSLIALLFVLSFTTAFGQDHPPAALPDIQAVNNLGTDLFLQSGSTGMVLVVVRDNQVFFRGYGETAPNSHQLPTQDSLLRLCSLTKIFTTDVLTKLVADNTVRLDDTLQRYAPPGTLRAQTHSSHHARRIWRHTPPACRANWATPPATRRTSPFPTTAPAGAGCPISVSAALPAPPPLYSNVAFDFLSDALQSAAHKQYAALLAERTLNPLHMQQTTFFPNAEQCRHLLIGAHDDGPCTATEATAGSSGLYSTAADMAIWLKYLLATGGPGSSAQDASAQAIYILPSDLVSQKGLDHAGEPTGVGLGWIHLLPADSPSHIIEKTGGGAGFETYIAINHSRHTAIFVAATDGPVDTHLNLFNAANELLLAVAGLPPLPPPPPKPVPRRTRPRRRG